MSGEKYSWQHFVIKGKMVSGDNLGGHLALDFNYGIKMHSGISPLFKIFMTSNKTKV